MADTFRERIPALPDAELQDYVRHPDRFTAEALELAAAELRRRGRPVVLEELLERRERGRAKAGLAPVRPLDAVQVRRRVRLILALGFAAALLLYLLVPPAAGSGLGYDPMDTKKYLRDLELYGGKSNVLATRVRLWLEAWASGRNLAALTALLTLLAAWLTARLGGHGDRRGAGPRR